MKSKTADILLALVALIWGSGFAVSQMALDANLSPFSIMTYRFLISTLLMVIIFWKYVKDINLADIKAGAIIGFFLFIAFAFQTIGLQYTTPSKNAFLTATNVILVPFLYWIVLRRTPDKYSIIGAVLTIIGISFLTLESSSLALSWGDILTLICALGFALHIISIGYYTKKHHPIKLTILQIFTAFILSVSAMLFTRESFSINYKGFISVMYLGAMGTTVTFLLQNVAQKYTNATKAAIILSTEAVFGTLASVIFLGEVLNIKMILGCFIIFTGILIAETKLSFINSKKNLKTEKAG